MENVYCYSDPKGSPCHAAYTLYFETSSSKIYEEVRKAAIKYNIEVGAN